MKSILYRIKPFDLAGHLFSVELHIQHPHADGQTVSLPTWIPGSYLVRDFSRHLQQFCAHNDEKSLHVRQLDNHTWKIEKSELPITISYLVYAWDLSVRAAHLDETHGFFNGTSVFLKVHDQEESPCYVDIQTPFPHWKVYTSLPEAQNDPLGAKRHEAGLYKAKNYDDLIDHPVEMGTPAFVRFEACGAVHEMVFTGVIPNLDLKRIAKDTATICEYQIKFFEPETHQAPFLDSSDRYVFMVMVTDNGYGGLEHRSSTALMASRQSLPVTSKPDELSDDYCQFLGLISHEYFHTWNVKRIKPQCFAPYDLQKATPTSLLWIFEGFTSYYDDLVLKRTNLITESRYFSLLQNTMNSVYSGAGRFKQSVAQSSFDAWTKYYKQDENSPNAIVNYYTKGSLIALALDLFIQQESQGKHSLDDFMRLLWVRYGRDFYRLKTEKGLYEYDVIPLIEEATGVNVRDFIYQYVVGTKDLPLEELWEPQGVLVIRNDSQTPSLNIKTKVINHACHITHVEEKGSAHRAGISAGDILVAIDNLKVSENNLNTLLSRYALGDDIHVHVFRRDELRRFTVRLFEETSRYSIQRFR